MKRGNSKKILFCIVTAVLLSFVFSGCAVIPADISELERPPKLTGEQQAIENALESKVGNKFTLKYPLNGDYRSAFVLKDLNHDGNNEALAFYSPSNGTAGPHIALLNKSGGKWKFETDIGSDGSEIDCIAFGDFEGKGSEDLAVGWRSFNSTDLTLMVYSKKSDNSYAKTNLGSFTKIKTLDMDGDKKPDILLLKLDSNEKLASARLISYKNGKLSEIARAPLDSTVTSYAGVYETKVDSKTSGVMIDGYRSSDNMITELIYYKDGKLVAPFYDYYSHTVSVTRRSAAYESTDINGDGVVEVPLLESLPSVSDSKNDNKVWLVKWSAFDGNYGLSQKLECIMNYSEDYYFIYPKKWGTNVTVNRQAGDGSWQFCEWDSDKNIYGKILFTIRVYKENEWSTMPDKDNLYRLSEKNGTAYVAMMPQQAVNDSLGISIDEIRKDFMLLNN